MDTRVANKDSTVHERYRRLIRAGFTRTEAAGLIAHIDGVDHHHEGEDLCGAAWRWQEIARLEFLRYLVATGRLRDEEPSSPRASVT